MSTKKTQYKPGIAKCFTCISRLFPDNPAATRRFQLQWLSHLDRKSFWLSFDNDVKCLMKFENAA
jgi:hypothetical protein